MTKEAAAEAKNLQQPLSGVVEGAMMIIELTSDNTATQARRGPGW